MVLPSGKKPSVQYRTSAYTVAEYCALPYAQRLAEDAACNEAAGLAFTTYDDETSEKPYTVGRATRKVKSAQPAQLPSTTSQPSSPMTTATAYVHPAPSPALHFLNTPELIEHDEAHPDNERTSAVPVGQQEPSVELRSALEPGTALIEVSPNLGNTDIGNAIRNTVLYDLAAIVSRYVTLTPNEEGTEWTHWGPSPLVGGDTHSFAVNTDAGTYKCFTSGRSGRVVDFVMFMEELSEAEAVEWLETNYPTGFQQPAHESKSALVESAAPDFASLAEATAEAAQPVAPAAPVAVDGTIYHTTDYDIFKKIAKNRVVSDFSVRRLVAAIQRKNLLHVRPIDVTTDMEVIDGQHRLLAARELGVPVYYKIGQQLSAEDIAILNAAQKNWAPTDYLHSWAVEGLPAYVTLKDFMDRHPIISFSNAKLMLGTTTKHDVDGFRKGEWQVADTYRAERVAEMVEAIAAEVKTFKQPTHTGFVSALFYCVTSVGGFDSKEMLRTIRRQPLSLVPCASHKQWLLMLGTIYNWSKRTANQLRFE